MANHTELINQWARVAHMSQRLLDLAKQGEWEALLSKEEDYLHEIESIIITPETRINQDEQAFIETCLKRALENEVTLEKILHQRLETLNQLISQSVRQRSINSAYGSISGMILTPEPGSEVAH